MRIQGIIFLGILAVLVFGASFFITDELVEKQLEKQLSIANRALVEFEDLEFSLWELHLAWSRLQVTDPNNTMTNSFETGATEFDVQFWPLLWKKIIIDEVKMTGFALNTPREKDGYFEVPEEETPEDTEAGFFSKVTEEVSAEIAQNARMQFTDVKNDINVDSLLALVDLQSIEKMDSLKVGVQGIYAKWDSTISNNSITQQVAEIKTLVNAVNINQIDDVPKAVAAIENLKKVKSKADSLKTEITHIKTNFQNDLTTTRNSLESIDNWIQDDINRAANVAKLPEINAQSIGTALFGQNLLADLNKYLGYLAIGREYGTKFIGEDDESETMERYQGKNYAFSDKYDLPELWIKKIELSGVTNNNISLSGLVTNVSNNQKKSGEPVVFTLAGKDANNVSLTLNGELNYLTDEKRESLEISYKGFSLKNTKLSPSELLPYTLNSGTGELTVEVQLVNKRINSQVQYIADNLAFDFAGAGTSKNTVERLIRNAISGTEEINATALIDNTQGPLRVRVRSNIDDLFLNTLRQTVQAEVDNAKQQIRKEVETRVNTKRREVEALVASKEQELREHYDEFEARINEELQIVEKKSEELQAKKKELEDAIKNKAVDVLKKKIGF